MRSSPFHLPFRYLGSDQGSGFVSIYSTSSGIFDLPWIGQFRPRGQGLWGWLGPSVAQGGWELLPFGIRLWLVRGRGCARVEYDLAVGLDLGRFICLCLFVVLTWPSGVGWAHHVFVGSP